MKVAELLPSSRWLVQGCDTGILTASSDTQFHVPVEFVFLLTTPLIINAKLHPKAP